MKSKSDMNFDKEALDNLKVGECLEAEMFDDENETILKMKVCKTKAKE